MKRALLILTAAAFLFALTFPASAGSLTVPNTFTQGSPAYAASVNDNFTAVETEVTNNANDIAANAASIDQNRQNISANSLDITTHTHTTGDIISGTFTDSYFSAYSDLGAEGRLDNDAGADLLTRSQADGLYPSVSHTHSASGIVSGTLDTGLFSAYDDLVDEGMIGTDSGDLITRGLGDAQYIRLGKVSYYSVAPADCGPENESYSFTRTTSGLESNDSLSPNYFCSVHLPQNATVQSLTVAWTDSNGGSNANASLSKWSTPSSQLTMASLNTSGLSGFGTLTDSSIINGTVDNTAGGYVLSINLPSTNLVFHYATIGYQMEISN